MANLKVLLLRMSILLYPLCIFSQNAARDSSNAYYERMSHVFSIYGVKGQAVADTALVIDPTNAYMWQQKAMPHLKNGDFPTWIQFINKAVELNPERYLGYRGFCKTMFMKDYENALLDFENLQKRRPNTPLFEMDHTIDFFKSLCHLELGNLEKAKEFMEKSIKWQLDNKGLDWTHYVDLFYLGVIYFDMNDVEKAEKYINMSLVKYADFPDALYYKALILQKQNKNRDALSQLDALAKAKQRGYRMNEDNEIYANYPKQIGEGEVLTLRMMLSK
jgi:tetratricopeptide (TPR) repeat protein